MIVDFYRIFDKSWWILTQFEGSSKLETIAEATFA